MTQQQTTLNWTLDTDEGPVVLCERHALAATNEAVGVAGIVEFEDMAEAAVILSALTALTGNPEDQLTFGNTDQPCDDCE